ncbi:MAG: hypothetical protein ACE37E_01300 [Hyphomicrobiales bacterium]
MKPLVQAFARFVAFRFFAYYLLTFAVLLTGNYAFYWIMPASFWVSYTEVRVADTSLADGIIQFRSERNIRRESNLGGLDVLFCDLNGDGEFGHFSSAPWRGDSTNPTDGKEISGPWAYQGAVPAPGTGCLLRAAVTIRLPYGITKQLEPVYSDDFTITQ